MKLKFSKNDRKTIFRVVPKFSKFSNSFVSNKTHIFAKLYAMATRIDSSFFEKTKSENFIREKVRVVTHAWRKRKKIIFFAILHYFGVTVWSQTYAIGRSIPTLYVRPKIFPICLKSRGENGYLILSFNGELPVVLSPQGAQTFCFYLEKVELLKYIFWS